MKINRLKLEEYATARGIKFLILFGSQALGNVREDSDYDIAELTTKEKNISEFKNYTDMLDFLTEGLELPDYRIDLTNLNKANPFHRYEVVSSGILLYGDEDKYAEYKAFAFRNYVDSKPLFELEKVLIKKRQKLFSEFLSKAV